MLPKGLLPRRSVDHCIEILSEPKPPFRCLYQISPSELLEPKKYATENLEAGRNRPGKSPYGSSLLFAKMKDGSLRGVVDHRGLNRVTKMNNQPVSRSDEMFDRLGRAQIFFKIDPNTGCIKSGITLSTWWKQQLQQKIGSKNTP